LTTERDLLERRVALRPSEIERQRKFQEKILQNIPAAVFWKDIAGTFMGCNETFCKFVGMRTPAEIIGKIPSDFNDVMGDCQDSSSSVLSRSLEEFQQCNEPLWSQHEHLIDADGNTRHVVGGLTTLAYNNDEVFGVLGTFQDVTSLKQAESQATALAEVIRQSPSEVYIFDAETLRFMEANKGACENLGYSREELLTMSPVDIKPGLTETDLREKLVEAKLGSHQAFEFLTVHQRKAGSQYTVQVNLHRTTFDSTDVFAAFVTDLTHRHAIEQQLSQSQKLESMGQLAAGVAHEINTPMQCVSGNV